MSPTLPPLPGPFGWRDGQITATLRGGEILFTTRLAGAAGAPIDLRRWDEPGERPFAAAALAAEIGLPAARVAQSHQVHEARVRRVVSEADLQAPPSDYDGQITSLTNVACVVRTADCLPVALIAPEAVGAVHAGWRGLALGVLQAAVAGLRELGATEIRAAIGPSARVCCYEVGNEVHETFAGFGAGARRGSHADLAFIARTILEDDGVTEIHDTDLCTICSPELLWSFRREGEAAGRQGVAAWRS
jgi:YfiH family protein